MTKAGLKLQNLKTVTTACTGTELGKKTNLIFMYVKSKLEELNLDFRQNK